MLSRNFVLVHENDAISCFDKNNFCDSFHVSPQKRILSAIIGFYIETLRVF